MKLIKTLLLKLGLVSTTALEKEKELGLSYVKTIIQLKALNEALLTENKDLRKKLLNLRKGTIKRKR